MLSSSLARTSRMTLAQTQRRHAGGFPARMAVQKNKFVEEWNGKREITEQTFGIEFGDVPKLILTLIVFPYGVYTLSRSELHSKGDRRYKDIV